MDFNLKAVLKYRATIFQYVWLSDIDILQLHFIVILYLVLQLKKYKKILFTLELIF